MQPSEPTRRKLTPEEEAALLAQQQPATAPATYQTDASTSGGTYAPQPVPTTAPPGAAPTYQTDASTSFGNYSSAPPSTTPLTWDSRPTLDFMMEGEKDPAYVEGGVVYQPPSSSIRQGRGPIESFPSNPPPPPTQGAGSIQSFPNQWQPTAESSFRSTDKPDWARTWTDAEYGTYLGQEASRSAGTLGGRSTAPGLALFNRDLVEGNDRRAGQSRFYDMAADPRFVTDSFPDQRIDYGSSAPVRPSGAVTPAQQAQRAEDARRAAVLPTNRSSGIWPTAPPGGPGTGLEIPTLEQVQEAEAIPSLMRYRTSAGKGPPPQPTYIPESSAPYQSAPIEPTMGTPGYDFMRNGGQGPFTTPTGWQHGAVGTGGGNASGMLTSYPGGGGGGLSLSQLGDDNPIRFSDPQNATAGGGSLLSPTYVPREQGPGQYEPRYREPGVYTTLPPLYPVTEPGMYEGRYERPGQAVPPRPVNEPGMYEPYYAQPGAHAPRAASTYYGGEVWPTPYTGSERLETLGTIQFGPNRNSVQVINPATGETDFREVTPPDTSSRPERDLGGATVVREGEWRGGDVKPNPAFTSRGQILEGLAGGGNALPPTPTATLGPSSSQLGYMASQNDPRVTRNAAGYLVLREDLPSRNPPVLGGLFGGTAPRTVVRGSGR